MSTGADNDAAHLNDEGIMSDAYNPDDIRYMTGEGVRWTEPAQPIVRAPVIEKLDTIMRNALTDLGYM